MTLELGLICGLLLIIIFMIILFIDYVKLSPKYTITSKRDGKDVPLFYNVEINGDFSIPVSKLDYDMVSVGDKIVIRSFMGIGNNCRLYKIEKV
ncbi:MAG: hypothetical protein JTJ21_13415 [Holdemanella sp.]|nr:hypothetical protein [Holdemanella sp.]